LLRAIHLGSLDALIFYLQKNPVDNVNLYEIAQMFNYESYLIRNDDDYDTIIDSKNSYWIRHLLESINEDDRDDIIEYSIDFFKSFLEEKSLKSEDDDLTVVCPGDHWL
jgi:hypothetical protein